MNIKPFFSSLLFAGFFLLLVSPHAGAEEPSEKPSNDENAIDSSTPAQDDSKDLSKSLANPIAALNIIPFQFDYNDGLGVDGNGQSWSVDIQPVVPFAINDDWNLISRTIIPVIDQQDVLFPGSRETGLGDTVQSFFFSPNEPGPFGEVFGVGLVSLLPTATNDLLGAEKWGLGPTAIALKQQGPWTHGGLVNHIVSVGGDGDRADVSATFIQPFISYVTESKKTTFSLTSEASYDWESEQWSVPLNFEVKQLVMIGKAPIQIGVGPRYWVDSPDNGPQGWGVRISATLIFPKFTR
jgi:hypothetical protein